MVQNPVKNERGRLELPAAEGTLREDWETYGRDWMEPGLWVMGVYRFGRWRYRFPSPLVRRPLSLLYKIGFVLVRGFTGVELPCEVRMGRRCRIYHGVGLVISGWAVLGDECILRQGVTIGVRRTGETHAPVLGDRVDVGVNAVLLGAIEVGDDALIGANSVVLEDIPAGATAIGVPARLISGGRAARDAASVESTPGMRL